MLSVDTVYKSEDTAGNVTYSTHPPSDAQRVEQGQLKADPSAEQQSEARQREQEFVEAPDQISQENEAAAAERAASIQTAQRKLSAAEKNLQTASEYRDDDWQGTVSGYRRLKESYFERVDRARMAVEQAKPERKTAKQRKQ